VTPALLALLASVLAGPQPPQAAPESAFCHPDTDGEGCRALRELVWVHLGTLRESMPAGYVVKFTDRDEALVLLLFDSRFERGSAKEQFTWRVRGDEARLVRYLIELDDASAPSAVRR